MRFLIKFQALVALSLLANACTSTTWTPEVDNSPDFQVQTEELAPSADGPALEQSSADPEVPAYNDQPTPEDCGNGMDDDWDGLQDCIDPECSDAAACSPNQEARVSLRLEASFWAIYAADDSEVYEDTSALDGQVQLLREQWDGMQWLLECTTWIPIAGERADHSSFDLWFELNAATEPAVDGCNLGEELPSLPVGIGFDSGESTAQVLRENDGSTSPWTLISGLVDWGQFASPNDYSVTTAGAPLRLLAP